MWLSKKIICLPAIVLLAACGKSDKELTQEQIRAKADSIVQSRVDKLRRQAREDLDKRLPIELKPKIDSIQKTEDLVQPVPVFPGDDEDSTPGNTSDSSAPAKK